MLLNQFEPNYRQLLWTALFFQSTNVNKEQKGAAILQHSLPRQQTCQGLSNIFRHPLFSHELLGTAVEEELEADYCGWGSTGAADSIIHWLKARSEFLLDSSNDLEAECLFQSWRQYLLQITLVNFLGRLKQELNKSFKRLIWPTINNAFNYWRRWSFWTFFHLALHLSSNSHQNSSLIKDEQGKSPRGTIASETIRTNPIFPQRSVATK